MARSPVLRVHAADLIDRETLIALRQRSSLMGMSLVFHAWAIIGSTMTLFREPELLSTPQQRRLWRRLPELRVLRKRAAENPFDLTRSMRT